MGEARRRMPFKNYKPHWLYKYFCTHEWQWRVGEYNGVGRIEIYRCEKCGKSKREE